jgi:hypothetical protein
MGGVTAVKKGQNRERLAHVNRLSRLTIVLAVLAFGVAALGGTTALAEEAKVAPPGSCVVADPINDYLAIQVASNGRFNSGATGVVTGRSFNISFAWPSSPGTSFTTIRLDGTDNVFGDYPGTLIQPPTDLPGNLANETIYEYAGGVRVTQRLEIVTGTSTGRPDTGMYKYIVTNGDSVPHDVGVRIMVDTMLNDNDAAPFRVPGVGAVTTEMDFAGAAVPQYWQAFASLDNPEIMAQGTLAGGEATRPDRFALTSWARIVGTRWDYTVMPGWANGDSAATVWWNPVTLAPGQTREFVTYYGLGTVSGTADLSVTGPAALSIVGGLWSPDPFTVTAYVHNGTGATLTDVPVTLTLPAGLGLAPGETAVHTIPSIAPGETQQTSYSVRPLASGNWTYTVSAVGQAVGRSISVPTLPRPILAVAKGAIRWSDYATRELEVTFNVSNTGSGAALNTRAIRITASLPVTVKTLPPIVVGTGTIAPGGSGSFKVKYTVPVGVSSFKTTIGLQCEDAAGILYAF